MSIFYYLLLGAITLATYLDLLLLLLVLFRLKRYENSKKKLLQPRLSFLIAVRNEENSIEKCIQCIHECNYPKEKIEVLIADDHSEDTTPQLLQKLSLEYDFVHVYPLSILPKTGENGKAIAIKLLAEKASGEYFYILDGDSFMNPEAPKALLQEFEANVGIVNGLSFPRTANFLSHLQKCDWLFNQALIGISGQLGFFTTAYGHNMLISKEAFYAAWWKSGAESSITEDFALARSVFKVGYDIRFVISPKVIATKSARQNRHSLIQQRVRWLSGALKTSVYLNMAYFSRAFLVIFIALFCLFHPFSAVAILSFRILVNLITIRKIANLIETEWEWKPALIFELYSLNLFLSALWQFIVFRKTVWKGRVFKL